MGKDGSDFMKITRSLWAIPAALALLIGSLLTGCGPGETSSSAGTPGTPAAENPQVVFGQQMVQSGMSYSLEGAEELKTGKSLVRNTLSWRMPKLPSCLPWTKPMPSALPENRCL